MLQTVPLYLAFLGTTAAIMVVALAIYMLITPYHELRLIQAGNRAAACSLGGTAIGFATALYGTASSTFSVLELAVWGALSLVCQIVVFVVVAFALPGFKQGIVDDKLGYGILLGALAIATGILNAGALSS